MKKKNTITKETGEDIVLDLENEAEGANEHDMCSMYRTLYEILLEVVPDKDATKIMSIVRDRGGFLP